MSVRKIRKSNAAQVPSSTAKSLAAVASHALTLKSPCIYMYIYIIFAGEVSSEQIMGQIQSLARKSIITQLLVGPKILPKYHSWCRLHSFFQASHCSLGGFSSTFSSRAFGSLRVARETCFPRDLNTDWWLLSQNLAEIWHEIWPAKLVETRWIRCFEY